MPPAKAVKGGRAATEGVFVRELQLSAKGGGFETIKVGDNVAMLPPDKGAAPFIARVERLETDGKGTVNSVQVKWYYRPEEVIGGRKVFHGRRELFQSDHTDWCNVNSIDYRCNVHTLSDWMNLSVSTEEDYFCRFHYRPARNTFKPDRVPIYCVCELPYNPDFLMVECETCHEWFHPECLGMRQDQVTPTAWSCPQCMSSAYAADGKAPKRHRAS